MKKYIVVLMAIFLFGCERHVGFTSMLKEAKENPETDICFSVNGLMSSSLDGRYCVRFASIESSGAGE